MEWKLSFHESPAHLEIVNCGLFTFESYQEMLEEILSHKMWRPGMDSLYDSRELDFAQTSYEIMSKAADFHAANDARYGDGKLAGVVKSGVDFGSARQFESLTSGKISAKIQIFSDMDEAKRWLFSQEDD